MIGNYIKVALRSIRRKPVYAFINITGHAGRMAAFRCFSFDFNGDRSRNHKLANRQSRSQQSRRNAKRRGLESF